MTIRERTEELEERMLAPYTRIVEKSLGRDAAEEPAISAPATKRL